MKQQPCPECGHLNPAGVINCANCRYTFDPKGINRQAQTTPTPVTNPLDQTTAIPDIEALGIKDDPSYAYGEEPETDVQTQYLDAVLAGDGPLSSGQVRLRGDLTLTEVESGIQFRIPHGELEEVVMGRANEQTGFQPTIDLAKFDGHKLGVSRRHATLSMRDNLLVLVDHGSTNGTYLNGHRVVPERPRVVRDGDSIQLGHVVLQISYQTDETEAPG